MTSKTTNKFSPEVRYDPSTAKHEVFPMEAGFAGSIALRENDGLVVALDNALNYFDPGAGAVEKFLQAQPEDGFTRLNDGRCDRSGRLWIGTMDNIDFTRPLGSRYRVDASPAAATILSDIMVSNSMAFSPDGKEVLLLRHTAFRALGVRL